MKVINEFQNSNKVNPNAIQKGECFLYRGVLYLKICDIPIDDDGEKFIEMIDLETGNQCQINVTEWVVKVDATVTFKKYGD